MSKPPAYQWYVREWLSSPTRLLMSKSERSAYRDLLDYMWDSGTCSLPDDPEKLRQMSGCTKGEWRRFSVKIMANFPAFGDGFVTNHKLMEQWKERKSYVKKQVEAAKKRWAGNATAMPPHMQAHIQGECSASASASASATTSKREEPKPKPTAAAKPAALFPQGSSLPDWIPIETWAEFRKMRNRIHKAMTEHAVDLIIKDLLTLKSQGFNPRLVLEQSIKSSWAGVFPLKGENGNDRPRFDDPNELTKRNLKNLGLLDS